MNRNDLKFATKVWLTGVLIPAVFWGFENIGDDGIAEQVDLQWKISHMFDNMALAIIFGSLFSTPSWLLLWVAVSVINRQTWETGIKKVSLCLSGLMLTLGAFALVNLVLGSDSFRSFGGEPTVVLCYFTSICIGILYFDLENHRPKLSEEPLDQIPEI